MKTHTLPYKKGYIKKENVDGETMLSIETLPLDFLNENDDYGLLFIKRGREGYANRVLEGAVNFLVEATTQRLLSMNKKGIDNHLNEQGINLEFVHMLHSFGMFAGYFINSTSWEDQKLHDFDKAELRNRLQKVMHYFKDHES